MIKYRYINNWCVRVSADNAEQLLFEQLFIIIEINFIQKYYTC